MFLFNLLLVALFGNGFTIINAEPLKICSWNLKDFGDSKSDAEIEYIANTIKGFDIIIIQEVVAGPGGLKAVVRLNDALKRKGAKHNIKYTLPILNL